MDRIKDETIDQLLSGCETGMDLEGCMPAIRSGPLPIAKTAGGVANALAMHPRNCANLSWSHTLQGKAFSGLFWLLAQVVHSLMHEVNLNR
jgi:hypothetical protein